MAIKVFKILHLVQNAFHRFNSEELNSQNTFPLKQFTILIYIRYFTG